MRTIRLVADDLTGALDTAVQFTGEGPIDVIWRRKPATARPRLAYDTGTRETSSEEAERSAANAATLLEGANLAFKKIDSLLRGHPAAELAGLFSTGRFDRIVVAPALPEQGRVTRGGRQYRRRAEASGDWEPISVDLRAELHGRGIPCSVLASPSEIVDEQARVMLCDAATREDLANVVAHGSSLPGRILWCGTAGLGAALASAPSPTPPNLSGPFLGIVGSFHPVTRAQLDALRKTPGLVDIEPPRPVDAHDIGARMQNGGAAILAFRFGPDTPPPRAAYAIARYVADLLPKLPPAATLFATGGETLKAVCAAIGVRRLSVAGELMPGVPVSHAGSPLWGDIAVMSKSGAFGAPDVLSRIIAASQT